MSGDLRASLKGVLFDELREEWGRRTTTQGDVMREAPREVALVLRAARKTREPRLFAFLLRAVTQQTPTSARNYPDLARAGLPLVCPLCGLAELARHPGVCPTSEVGMARLVRGAGLMLTDLFLWLASSGAVGGAHQTTLLTMASAPAR